MLVYFFIGSESSRSTYYSVSLVTETFTLTNFYTIYTSSPIQPAEKTVSTKPYSSNKNTFCNFYCNKYYHGDNSVIMFWWQEAQFVVSRVIRVPRGLGVPLFSRCPRDWCGWRRRPRQWYYYYCCCVACVVFTTIFLFRSVATTHYWRTLTSSKPYG